METREKGSLLHYKTYIKVWIILIFLTGLSVSLAGVDLGHWNIIFILMVAVIKSGFILNYFMHLKYEKRINLFRWVIPSILVLLTLFIGLTFLDVVFR